MATTKARNRYMAALRDNPSPTAKGRSKVSVKTLQQQQYEEPPPPPPSAKSKRKKSRVASRWQAAAQEKYNNSGSSAGGGSSVSSYDMEELPKIPAVPKMFSVTSPRVTAPPPPPPAGRSSRGRSKWNAEKEIPRGKVANSPFRPAPKEPEVHPSPQLRQQKQQWDAKRDIPKGKVRELSTAHSDLHPTTNALQKKQFQQEWNTMDRESGNTPRGSTEKRPADTSVGAALDQALTDAQHKLEHHILESEEIIIPVAAPDITANQPVTKELHWEESGDVIKSPTKQLQWEEPEEVTKSPKKEGRVWSPRGAENSQMPPKSPRINTNAGDFPPPPKSPRRGGDSWITSPRSQFLESSPRGTVDVLAADSPKRQWEPEAEIPRGAVSNSRIVKSNRIFFADDSNPVSPQKKHQKKQWAPEQDIPRGKVRGMSHLFDGNNTSPVKKQGDAVGARATGARAAAVAALTQPSLEETNHLMEPVEPAQASPKHSSPRIVKPMPIAASRSEEDYPHSPAVSYEQPLENGTASDFYKTGAAAVETDPWMVPSSSSNNLFGKGTWGEAANPSLSNDEYDDRDWFQSGSFTNEDEKKAAAEFDSFDGFGAAANFVPVTKTKTKPVDLDDSLNDDDDDEDVLPPPADSGSFAAAIQPVTSSRRGMKPETVQEEPDEEDALSEFSKGSKKSSVVHVEDEANSMRLKQLLENGATTALDQPSDSRSTSSSNSKKSSTIGFGKRNKKSAKVDTPTDKKRRGIFKLFSGRKQASPEVNSRLSTDVKLGDAMSPRTQKGKRNGKGSKISSPPGNHSLKSLTADVEKNRSHGVISTRDDVSYISEMTNPTVFLQKAASIEAASSPRNEAVAMQRSSTFPDQKSDDFSSAAKAAVTKQPAVATKPVLATKPTVAMEPAMATTVPTKPTSKRTVTTTNAPVTPVADPFDIHSPMFPSGDPWSTLKTPEHVPEVLESVNDAFSDPFFADEASLSPTTAASNVTPLPREETPPPNAITKLVDPPSLLEQGTVLPGAELAPSAEEDYNILPVSPRRVINNEYEADDYEEEGYDHEEEEGYDHEEEEGYDHEEDDDFNYQEDEDFDHEEEGDFDIAESNNSNISMTSENVNNISVASESILDYEANGPPDMSFGPLDQEEEILDDIFEDDIFDNVEDVNVSFDAPDPELEIMSSDDEAENDDPSLPDSPSKSMKSEATKSISVSPVPENPRSVASPLDEINSSSQRGFALRRDAPSALEPRAVPVTRTTPVIRSTLPPESEKPAMPERDPPEQETPTVSRRTVPLAQPNKRALAAARSQKRAISKQALPKPQPVEQKPSVSASAAAKLAAARRTKKQRATTKQQELAGEAIATPKQLEPVGVTTTTIQVPEAAATKSSFKGLEATPVDEFMMFDAPQVSSIRSGESFATNRSKPHFRGTSPTPADDFGRSTDIVQSVGLDESGHSTDESLLKVLQQSAGSNLSYKMRMKRYEKKMQRAKAMEDLDTPGKPQDNHVSTSAYLTRFKSKVPKVKRANESDRSTSMAPRSPYQSLAVRPSLSKSSTDSLDIETIPSIEARGSYVSIGSRSARRNLRTKGKNGVLPATANARGVTSVQTDPERKPVVKVKAEVAAPISKLQEEVLTMPRSILRKPRHAAPVKALSPTSSRDPMHRAGLRLLALAVIPIQAEMRRFMAKRKALNRMWAIIVIQTSARRWIVQRRVDREDEAALVIQSYFADYLTREYARVLIQSHVRRWLVEKSLLEAFAAIIIQANFRGWVMRSQYQEYRAAAIIQSKVRGWILVKKYTRLLAAIKIQKSARGMIARTDFDYKLAALRIQTAFRGYVAYRDFWQQVLAAIQIQAIFRGWYARDSVEDRHYCATQIQRIFRGYISTMAVYEDIYKVTLIQSFVRMKIAVETATYKLAFVIQMQSIMRGFLVRTKLKTMNEKAITMQRLWRGHSSRLNYQFDLLDIIQIQSLFRAKKARRIVESLNHKQAIKSAIVIQTRWRSYDCTMNYLHYLADVLIVQSTARRWAAVNEAKERRRELEHVSAKEIQAKSRGFLVRNRIKQDDAALSIQKTWRGFVGYAEYMFTIADIVIAQTQARCWAARRKHQMLSTERDRKSATAIQTSWRGFTARSVSENRFIDIVICQSVVRRTIARDQFRRNLLEKYSAETIQRAWFNYMLNRDEKVAATSIQKIARGRAKRDNYVVAIEVHRASIKIQSAWRRFWLFSNFIIMLDSAIVIQSVCRGHLAKAHVNRKHRMATRIQSKTRSIMARRTASAKSMVIALLSTSSAIAGKENDAALMIQTNLRSSTARNTLFMHRRARTIQTIWRGVNPRRALVQFVSSVRIQTWFRHLRHFTAYTQYRSATRIQSAWRACVALRTFNLYIGARKIQAAWRGASAYTNFKQYMGARSIQTLWRSFIAREKYIQYLLTVEAATLIQSAWRSFICYTDFVFTLSDVVTVQRIARGYIHRGIYARKLETRRLHEEKDQARNCCATHIQRVYRGSRARTVCHKMHCARRIQKVFRGGQARQEVELIKQYLQQRSFKEAAVVKMQSLWRGYDQKQKFWYLLGCVIQIQCVTREFTQRLKYRDSLGCVIVLQSLVRRWFALRQYNQMLLIESLIDGAAHEEREKNEAAMVLQNWYRNDLEPRVRVAAAIKVQSFFRMVRAVVDKEIKAERKRRRRRRNKKKTKKEADDSVLEDAWDSVSLPGRSSKKTASSHEIAQAKAAAANAFRSQSAPRQGRQDHSSGRGKHVRSKSRDACNKNEFAAEGKVKRKMLMPPSYYVEGTHSMYDDRPTNMVQMRPTDDSDALSVVSGLTTQSVIRPPPSRLQRMAPKAMTEDLSLEEAWVDMEIQNTKQKRKTKDKGKKHARSPRASPRDSLLKSPQMYSAKTGIPKPRSTFQR